MPLVFVSSIPIPGTEQALRDAYWYAVWDRPITVPYDLRRGGTVYLYDDKADVVVWRTTVTDTIAAPFEHVDDFRRMLASRWGTKSSRLNDAPVPGFGIAWRAEPDELLLTTRPAGARALGKWEVTGHLDPETAVAWGFEADIPCIACTGAGRCRRSRGLSSSRPT